MTDYVKNLNRYFKQEYDFSFRALSRKGRIFIYYRGKPMLEVSENDERWQFNDIEEHISNMRVWHDMEFISDLYTVLKMTERGEKWE